jgi:RNA polymerase sigma-70 factor (ECF subfamily)
MQDQEILPHLFRTESRKIISVLCKIFGLEHIEVAEDIVSDTFLLASETWGLKGIPENPTAWLYAVSKNKAKDYCKRSKLFSEKISVEIRRNGSDACEDDIDLSEKNITDSQLQMMFAICDPSIPIESQIGLCLRILCGFGIDEIAEAFLTNRETIKKRLGRAKLKLKEINFKTEFHALTHIDARLEPVITTLYLLYNEGYYSSTQNTILRKDLCFEAMRLTYLLVENDSTNKPFVNALLALMCFQSSRFDARTNDLGEFVLYEDQDHNLWNKELIDTGEFYMNEAAKGNEITRYHLEAAIAYWHTHQNDTAEKWENILQLYNKLLQIEYSPIAALNRTYALYKTGEKAKAIKEAEKLNLSSNHLYYTLLGNFYSNIDNSKARNNFEMAMNLARTETDKSIIANKLKSIPT